MLTPVETIKIFSSFPTQTFKAGEIIFHENETGKLMYGLIEGEVEMCINGKVIETIKIGDVFGQGAIVQDDHSRLCTARAKTDCQVAALDRNHFLFAIDEAPLFALQVIKSFSNRMRNLKKSLDTCLDK